jgi:D-alanyl-D-alanine carboxypeptidase
MLAEIVARVYSQRSGAPRSFAQYLDAHLVGPFARVPLDVHFPDRGSDQALPAPRACGNIVEPGGETQLQCDLNISAKVAEGNGIGTLRILNRWVRSLFGGDNALTPASVALMKHDTSAANPHYALGTFRVENLGYGHNGATNGTLSQMAYDLDRQVSVVVLLPMWDLSEGEASFLKVFNTLNCASWDAREALGYSGRPASANCPYPPSASR